MAKEKDNLTPMMRQYMKIKEEHQDKVLFFRLGDFYEMFDQDAIEVSRLLNLTLTKRAGNPMCGVPYHAAKNYIKRLLDLGKKIAICEQIDLNEDSKDIAERRVVQIYTPATVVEDEFLNSTDSSFIMSIYQDRRGLAVSYADVTTGDFFIRDFPLERSYRELENAIYQIEPKEILVLDDLYFSDKSLRTLLDSLPVMLTKLPSFYFSKKSAKKELEEQFSKNLYSLFSIDENETCIFSSGALLKYIKEMSKTDLDQFKGISRVSAERYMFLSSSTIKSLELVSNQSSGKSEMSLFSSINRTVTSSGARMLKSFVLNPLYDRKKIDQRLSWVDYFFSRNEEEKKVRDALSLSSDLERIASKISMNKIVPRDLIAISDSVSTLSSLIDENRKYLELVENTAIDFPSLLSLSSDIDKAINRECTNINGKEKIINDGYSAELDEVRNVISSSNEILSSYLNEIKNETGINNIRCGENRIIGYYLEVSKGNLNKVPSYFIRRQSLVGGERFKTEKLDEIESRINSSRENEGKIENRIYKSFISRAEEVNSSIEMLGKIISYLDVYSSLSYLAHEEDYTRPLIEDEGTDLILEDARHPVVEQYLKKGEYVRNSFSSQGGRFSLITGPNMAGKSTYLRQTALIVLLSHIGSYVPASKAVGPLTDKLFCRVGAQDNLAKGESTFLVEMTECAQILRYATRNSLVIMDEIGRGTSTQDGMSIAYAVIKYMKNLGAVTLFSTHYHELTGLDSYGSQLLTMKVEETKGSVIFLRKAVKGIAASSYGIHVAKLAGIPRQVIKDAQDFLKKHFADYSSLEDESLFKAEDEEKNDYDDIISSIRDFDIENSSAMNALLFLLEIKKKLT